MAREIRIQALVCVLIAASLASSAPAVAQHPAAEAHTDAAGPSTICGLTGENALALMTQLRASKTLELQPKQSPRFEIYQSRDARLQFVATASTEPAHPAVTCRRLFTDTSGGTSMDRQMRCDASREACDKLFEEFSALDERMRDYLKRR